MNTIDPRELRHDSTFEGVPFRWMNGSLCCPDEMYSSLADGRVVGWSTGQPRVIGDRHNNRVKLKCRNTSSGENNYHYQSISAIFKFYWQELGGVPWTPPQTQPSLPLSDDPPPPEPELPEPATPVPAPGHSLLICRITTTRRTYPTLEAAEAAKHSYELKYPEQVHIISEVKTDVFADAMRRALILGE